MLYNIFRTRFIKVYIMLINIRKNVSHDVWTYNKAWYRSVYLALF